MNKALKIFYVIVAILIAYMFFIQIVFERSNTDDHSVVPTNEDKTKIADYFIKSIQNKLEDHSYDKINNLKPKIIMNIYPGFTDKDFNGVETLLGEYKLDENGDIGFTNKYFDTNTSEFKKDAEIISPTGMYQLLLNVSKRLNIKLRNKSDVDSILLQLEKNDTKNIDNDIKEKKIELKINNTEDINGIKITPISILEDSRCPQGAVCIQQGTVRVLIKVKNNNEYSTEIRLGNSKSIENIALELADVAPYPAPGKKIEEDEYVLTFIIKQL